MLSFKRDTTWLHVAHRHYACRRVMSGYRGASHLAWWSISLRPGTVSSPRGLKSTLPGCRIKYGKENYWRKAYLWVSEGSESKRYGT